MSNISYVSKAARFEGKKCYGFPLVDALFNGDPNEKRANSHSIYNMSIYICI